MVALDTTPVRGRLEDGPLRVPVDDGTGPVVVDVATLTAWAETRRAETTARLLKELASEARHAVCGFCAHVGHMAHSH